MIVDASIFKAYDIRGVYGKNLFDEVGEAIGKAFPKVVPTDTVVIGRDARVSSPALHDALIKGLTSVGMHVIDVGMVSTDMYYYACQLKNVPGIMITASHNPKEYNGFKMVRKIPYLLSGEEGIQDIRKAIENDDYAPPSQNPGTVEACDIMDGFIDKILSLVEYKNLKPMKVIVDTANGMVGPSIQKLFQHLPQIELVEMYFDPDGTFPNHGGDPLQEENRKELQERVVSEHADLGFAFDPDGDRFFCIDKKGRFVSGDFMTTILARYFLQKSPGKTIVYDIRSSNAVPETVHALGGVAIHNRVGHAFIKKTMMDKQAIMGGEITGHYYFQDFFYCDSGLAPMMFVMDLLTHSSQTFDQMLDELGNKYFISGEINTKGVDSAAVLKKIQETYAPSAKHVLTVDGISIIYDQWHFNVRASNTEPLVRLNLEATTQEMMEQKRDEVLAVIRG